MGPWNKWRDPHSGRNRLCRESPLTQRLLDTLPATPGEVGRRPSSFPRGLPHGECGVWGGAPLAALPANFTVLVTRKVSPKNGKCNVIQYLHLQNYRETF